MLILILIIILLIGGLLFFYIGYRNTFDLKQRKIELQLEPPLEKSLPILHLSDMHIERLSIQPKGLLQPTLGVYIIFGNNDYNLGKHIHLFQKTLEDQGCIVLQNENKVIPFGSKTLYFIGIDNYSTGHANIQKAYRGVNKGLKIVLTHDPNIILKMDGFSFDYLLAGHFHGGQIHWLRPFHMVKYGEVARMNMITGLHYYQGRPFYISEGLGQSGIKVRIGTRPEITLHRLY